MNRSRFDILPCSLTIAAVLSAIVISGASAQSCGSDLNDDGIVDAADLSIVLANWGPCPITPPAEGSVFLVIDSSSIDNGNPPNFFSAVDVNDTFATVGFRAPLPAFSGANVGTQITLWTGEVGDEGWFAVKTIPASWSITGPTADGLQNFVLAGPGLGSGPNPEILLDQIPNVTPLRATGLAMLEGETIAAIVYDSDVSINYGPLTGNLQGANLGIVAFKVIAVTQLFGQSSGSLPAVTIEIVDPTAAFAGPLSLFLDAPAPISSSVPFDIAP